MTDDEHLTVRIMHRVSSVFTGRAFRPAWENPLAFKHMVQKVEGLFDNVAVDPDRLARLRAMPCPDRRYVIFFTPRSSSSRLADLIAQTGYLNNPGEPFNPAFVPANAASFAATDLESYAANLMRARARNGVFGCEITLRHLYNTLGGMDAALRLLEPTAFIWLIREDIVAQAVSISRKNQTKIAHSSMVDETANARAELGFRYDPRTIQKALMVLAWQEERMEELFERHRIEPLRLSYEMSIESRESDLLRVFGQHIGTDLPRVEDAQSSHGRLAGVKASEFIETFKRENRPLLRKLEQARRGRLERIIQVSAMVA